VVLKNGLKTEFITYVPRHRHLRNKKHNNNNEKKNKHTDSDDNHSATGSDRESDMFYGDAEDFDDSQGVETNASGHKLDAAKAPGNTATDHNHGSSATVTGQTVNGAAEGNHRGVKDIGLDTPTIIYFHGGGFCFGSVPVYRR
jgi:acetyl esterase/lipase